MPSLLTLSLVWTSWPDNWSVFASLFFVQCFSVLLVGYFGVVSDPPHSLPASMLGAVVRLQEQPFGVEPQCLALSAVCRTIEIAAAEAMQLQSPAQLLPGEKYNLL